MRKLRWFVFASVAALALVGVVVGRRETADREHKAALLAERAANRARYDRQQRDLDESFETWVRLAQHEWHLTREQAVERWALEHLRVDHTTPAWAREHAVTAASSSGPSR